MQVAFVHEQCPGIGKRSIELEIFAPDAEELIVGPAESLPGSERAETRRRLEELVNEAEALVAAARDEAARIVARARAETTPKVERLVSQAEELRVLAESQAAEVREEAERERAAARSQADQILASARATHDEILEHARRVEADPDGGGPGEGATGDARVEADRILRIARSEAEARAAEIIEQARRRAEAAEADGRHKVETLRQTHRALQRRMREEEIEVRSRIADLKERLGANGGVEPAPVPGRRPKRAPAEEPVADPAETSPQPAPRVARAPAEYPWSIREQMEESVEDPDILKGLRAIRRRT